MPSWKKLESIQRNTMPSLYDLSIEGLQIQDILAQNEGELTPELEQRLDELLQSGPSVLEAAAIVSKQLDADGDLCRQEGTRLLNRAAGFHGNAKKLRDRMRIALDCAFHGKIKTPKFTIWTQKSPDRTGFDLREESTLEALQEAAPEFVRVTLALNREALQEAYKRGESLPESIFVDERPGERYTRIS
jgi:hypothetical protein